jgi:hypothetical protein
VARRRDRGDAPTRAELVALDDVAADKRYRWLAMYLMASELGSIAANLSAGIRAERDRLDRTPSHVTVRLAALEKYLDERGLLRKASAFADRFCNNERKRM